MYAIGNILGNCDRARFQASIPYILLFNKEIKLNGVNYVTPRLKIDEDTTITELRRFIYVTKHTSEGGLLRAGSPEDG